MRNGKLFSSSAISILAAGSAAALGLENLELVIAPEHAYPIADALDFDGGITDTVQVGFGPSAGSFPSGNVLVFVDITGGTFSAALAGAEVTIAGGTSVISSGGLKGGTSVTFLVSGADACTADVIPFVVDTTCELNIPVALSGDDVTFSVGLETDAGAPIDNSASSNRTSLKVIETAPAFLTLVVPDIVPTFADLSAPNVSVFKRLRHSDAFGSGEIGSSGLV